ncbi:L10-interacting MYB domain-containing protein-like [Syzygium oleosum]|uniref:L10-interacting MYB domain-containing protein-like n=1 Tax=Syzygium oleosum TaxID=219896 RepID=UPI0024BBC9B2|nr:L10-interacting MYB domain-containing protein-like [Syzygium oleosum]
MATKAFWSTEDVETFCKLCIEQIEKGNRPANNKRDGWTVIISKFEELTGRKYDKNQMKSKWDNLKEEWKRWRTLVYNETGLGWDSRKKTVDASDEWWEKKIQANPKLKTFRTKGIHPDLAALLDRMFRETVANGGITWTPGQGLRIDEDLVEVTQPSIGDGVGSNDENLESQADETVEPIGTQSHKRAAHTSMRQARGKKEKRLTTAQQLGTQISRLCSAVEQRSAAAASSQANEGYGPYKDLIDMLDTIPEIVQDEKLYFFAISHFKKKKDNRQVFMSLKGDALKVKYLKYEFEQSHS